MPGSLRRQPGGGDPHPYYALEEEFREHVDNPDVHGGGVGTVGPQGEDGLSAYEVAVLNGFQGDEAAWLASLVGPQGPAGPQGVPGNDGAPGTQGPAGDPGDPGEDGLSAYEIAVLDGFVGTEPEWLDSLVGPEGPQGSPGVPGTTDWNGITNKPSTFTPSAHSHAIADTTGLQAALDGKQAAGSYAAASHTHAQSDVTGLTAALAAKADTSALGTQFLGVFRQSADVTNATTTPANCTGLVFSFVANGVYAVELFLLATAAATTTGFGYALDTSVAVNAVALTYTHVLANTGTATSGQSRADAVAVGLTSGVDTINVVVPIMGSGILVAGANAGTAQLQFRPEVAASATAKANSVMRVMRIA